MMNRIARAALAASMLCAVVGASALWTTSPAIAADTSEKITPAVGKPLAEAQGLMTSGDYQGAMAKIKEAQAVDNRTPTDDYKINQFLAACAIGMKDYATATTATEAAADSPVLPDAEKKSTYFNALLLAVNAKDYKKATVYGQDLDTMKALDEKTAGTLAIAYFELKDLPHAQQYAQQSIDIAKAAGHTPDPNALRIVMSGQVGQNDQSGAEKTLEALVIADPDESSDAWRQLVDVALSAKGSRDLDALYLFRLKVTAGAMTDAEDYTVLAGLAEQLGYPTEAVSVLEKGIAAGKVSSGQAAALLAKGHKDAAQDEHLLPSIADAAQKSKTGEQEAKLGEDYLGYGRYADAEAAARAAMAKGGLKDPGEGNLLLGVALVQQAKYDAAAQAFSQVGGSESKLKVAHLWSLYAQAKAKKAGAAPAAPAATPPAH